MEKQRVRAGTSRPFYTVEGNLLTLCQFHFYVIGLNRQDKDYFDGAWWRIEKVWQTERVWLIEMARWTERA